MHDDRVIRRRRAVLVLLVLGCLALLTASFGGSGGAVGSLQRGVFEAVSPIQDGASRGLKPARDLLGWAGDTWRAKGENDALRSQLDAVRLKQAQYDAFRQENASLRRLLDLDRRAQLSDMGLVTARISAVSPTVFSQNLAINKGSADGLRTNQAVVAGAGLVGRIGEVTPHASKVVLLTDSTFYAAAKVGPNGVSGAVRPADGSPRELILDDTGGSPVPVAATVVTKGTDPDAGQYTSLFPPDVPIGLVTRVDDAGSAAQKVHVRPYVRPRDLTYVQVVTRLPQSGAQ